MTNKTRILKQTGCPNLITSQLKRHFQTHT